MRWRTEFVAIALFLAGIGIGYVLGLRAAVTSARQAQLVCALDLEFQRLNDECRRARAAAAKDAAEFWDVFREED